MKKYAALIAVVVLGTLLAVIGTTPPSPAPADSDLETFSAARAMEDVRIIARAPHPTGSEENALVRGYIIERLNALGLEVSTTEGEVEDQYLDRFEAWSGMKPEALTLTNIIGILPGTDRDLPAVALMAHHDTVWASPGASDDTAGVASILETLRAINAIGTPKRDIVVLITDGEELGLLGARQFFASNPLSDRIGALINLEARGAGGRTTLFQTSAGNSAAVQIYADAVGRPAGSSLSAFVYENLPNDTDLTPALERDYVSYNFAFIGRSGLYHSPMATPENLDQGALQDMGDQTLALTRALAGAESLPERSENRTFFDAFGLMLISYGTSAGWLLLGGVAALNLYCLRLNQNPAGILRGIGASALVIVGGGALLFAFNWLSGAGAGGANYYDRLAAIPRLEAQALLICVAILAATAPLWTGKRASIIGVLVALGLQIFLPTTSYILVWPLLLGGIASVLSHHLTGIWSVIGKVIPSALLFGFVLQYGHQLMQGVGPDLPSVVALLAVMLLPVLGLLVPSVDRKRAFTLAGVCLVLAAAIALWVRFDPVADTVAAYESMKG
ncbi:M20/M25/M40 family metallo-hydrolase [Pontixanthobacter aquaemixtae]|uniref:Vacuolar membrane protease n=1 Tax=Pontixanthobacter aquaemixtae TaxID=1958940 RepID=A0A844ZTN8_9SPHN|nr:M20/M25/M40 family metallo-hydrolase [Pontixanthobacter aquaemixtae]MXO90167.1 M20/M25/M40 family metallo-hydrolase [Pontixanthobacter aquaemixtae]